MGEPSAADEPRLLSALAARRSELTQQDRWRTALVLALYAGDLDRASQVVQSAARNIPPVTVLDDVLAPAMHDIGALWEHDEITIADEHLATFVLHRLLADLYPAFHVAPPASRDTVLLATPEPERHTAGLLMAHDVLRGAGYETACLGGGVPEPALVAALERHRPALVGLSATMPFASELEQTVESVFRVLPGARVLIGGAAAHALAPKPASTTSRASLSCWGPPGGYS